MSLKAASSRTHAPYRPLLPTVRGAATVAASAAAVMLVVGMTLRTHPVDLPVVVALNHLHTGALGHFTDALYSLLGPAKDVVLAVVAAGVIALLTRNIRTGLAFGGIVGALWLPIAIFKELVARPRPDVAAMMHPFSPWPTDASFSSGHTGFITALAVASFLLLRDTRWKKLTIILGVIAVAIMGFAVMINGLHYPSDVLASIFWVLASAPLVQWFIVEYLLPKLRWIPGA